MTKLMKLPVAAAALALCLAAPAALAQSAPVDDAMRLMRHVMADGGLSPADKELINTLREARVPIEIDIGNGPERLAAPDDEAADLLGLFLSRFDVSTIWLKGEKEMRLFVRVSDVAPATFEFMSNFVAKQFLAAWQQSSISNSYKPLRDLIQAYYKQIGPVGSDTHLPGRRLGFDAMKRVDEFASGNIPDNFYNWLNVEG